MPTKIIANLETGEISEVELEGEELEAYENSLLLQQSQPEPTQNITIDPVDKLKQFLASNPDVAALLQTK